MKLVTDQHDQFPLVWNWMSKRTNLPWSTDLRTIGVMRADGTIAAAVGFNAWQTDSCFMHVAFDTAHSLTRSLLKAAFEFPFGTCGKRAVYALIGSENDACLRLVEKLGYRQIQTTVDCVMFEMLSDECRWVKEKNCGQSLSTSHA